MTLERKDHLTPTERSDVMRKVRAQNTGPERALRRYLHRRGYRFRLHRRDLPGTPDLVFPGRNKIIFVHGCFWHGHSCRAGQNRPRTNVDYWEAKLKKTQKRDRKNRALLIEMGWDIKIIWECDISNPKVLKQLEDFLIKNRGSGK